MPPKGNDTPPPSPLRSQRLLEISPSPGGGGRASEEADLSSSFVVDAGAGGGGGGGTRTRPPLVSGPIVAPDLSAAEDGDDDSDGADDRNDGAGGPANDDVGGLQHQRGHQIPRPASVTSAAVTALPAPPCPLRVPSAAAAAAAVTDDDDDDHPQHRDESLPCPTAFPRAAKARRTAHPASPPAGDIFRRIREAEDHDRDNDGDSEDDDDGDDDDDGSLDEVCLNMGLRMEMEPHGERLTKANDEDEGEAPTDERGVAKVGGPKSDGDEAPQAPWASSSLQVKTNPLRHLRRASECSTPRRSSLKKVSSTSVSYVSSSTKVVAHRRRISFSSLEIRPYSVTLGDHPCCSSGPPLSLGWDYDEAAVVSVQVEEYESSRVERRTRREMRMGCEARRERLLDNSGSGGRSAGGGGGNDSGSAQGMTERDLRRAERKVYRERSRTRPVHQARKATGFFFSSPPPPPSGSNVVVVRTAAGALRGMQE